MADIELVIKIPEEEYINIKSAINSLIENGVERASISKVCLAILGGTPLPKGHGDLIDRDKLGYDCSLCAGGCDHICYCDGCSYNIVRETTIKEAPIIIEADKENKE